MFGWSGFDWIEVEIFDYFYFICVEWKELLMEVCYIFMYFYLCFIVKIVLVFMDCKFKQGDFVELVDFCFLDFFIVFCKVFDLMKDF